MIETDPLNQILKKHKLRQTKARQGIYQLLKKSSFSLTPKEVFEQIDNTSNTDLASVYRNLSLFEELGIVHRFQDGKYTSCDHKHSHHDRHHDHVHVINHCTSCGKSSEIESHSKDICEVAKKLTELSNLLEQHAEIVVHGLCKRCAKTKTSY